jgi:hypothetical protein
MLVGRDAPRVQLGREEAGGTTLAKKRARGAPLGHSVVRPVSAGGVASLRKRIKAFDI